MLNLVELAQDVFSQHRPRIMEFNTYGELMNFVDDLYPSLDGADRIHLASSIKAIVQNEAE